MVMMVVMLTVANVGHMSYIHNLMFFPRKVCSRARALATIRIRRDGVSHTLFQCIDIFTHKNFYTQENLHTLFWRTKKIHIFLHGKTFAQMSSDTQIILHNEASIQRDFSPQTFLH